MRLPNPPARYDRSTESRRNQQIEQEDSRNRKQGRDVALLDDERFILRSPDGTLFAVTVDNTGALQTEEITL